MILVIINSHRLVDASVIGDYGEIFYNGCSWRTTSQTVTYYVQDKLVQRLLVT